MYDEFEERRLKSLWDAEVETAAQRNVESAKTSIEIANGLTQYFEKLSLGAGATIAGLVSFVGAHSTKLQPEWLFRVALLTLALTMTSALLRNWLYPYYLMGARLAIEYEAKQRRDQYKSDYVLAVQPLDLLDGKPIVPDEWIEEQKKRDAKYSEDIKKYVNQRKTYYAAVGYVQKTTLLLAAASVFLLVWLAWRNF